MLKMRLKNGLFVKWTNNNKIKVVIPLEITTFTEKQTRLILT
jgi:hypothetical protein